MSRFVLSYFEKYPAPFEDVKDYYPKTKRKKLVEVQYEATALDVVHATYIILKLSSDVFRNKWNWSYFVNKYFNKNDSMVQW